MGLLGLWRHVNAGGVSSALVARSIFMFETSRWRMQKQKRPRYQQLHHVSSLQRCEAASVVSLIGATPLELGSARTCRWNKKLAAILRRDTNVTEAAKEPSVRHNISTITQWDWTESGITDLCVKSQGTTGDILSNQHLLPVTAEGYRQMTCHVVTHCVMMCRSEETENRGVSPHTGERRSLRETLCSVCV